MKHRLIALAIILAPHVAAADDPAPAPTASGSRTSPTPPTSSGSRTSPPPPAPSSVPIPALLSSLIRTGAGPAEFPLAPLPRLGLDLALFVDGNYAHTADAGNLSQIALERGEVGAVVGLGRAAAAELRVESIRSAGDGGALGIGGDSLVARIERAQVAATSALGGVRLDGAAGLAANPWIAALEDGDPIRPLSRTAAERLLGDSPSDLAFVGRATYGPVRATVAVGNGEGVVYPERNSGKDTTVVVEVVPIAIPDVAHLRVAAMARDGSIGPASIRDHRFGAMATLATPIVDAGLEFDRGLGIAGEAQTTGNAIAGWIEARPIDHAVIAARGATLRLAPSGARTTVGGAIAVEPWAASAHGRDRFRIWLALDRTTSRGSGMPLVTDPADATTVMVIVSASRSATLDQD